MERRTKKCKNCNEEISCNNLQRHETSCNGERSYWMNRQRGTLIVDNSCVCKFCNKLCKNANSQRNHSRLCKNNPNKQTTYIMRYHKGEVDIPPFVPKNQYIKAKELGLPKPEVSDKVRKKLSEACKNKTPEQRRAQALKASQTIKDKVAKGEWHTSLAKKMHYSYKGFDLHGTWELKYAMWLDRQSINWIRCKESFKYEFLNKIRLYTPDFYLIESNTYIEIKGFKTEKDNAKWKQFPKKLIVLTKKELKEMGII